MSKIPLSTDVLALSVLLTDTLYNTQGPDEKPGLGHVELASTSVPIALSEVNTVLKQEETPKASQPKTTPREDILYNYEGENNRYVLILYNIPGNNLLPKQEKEFLVKVLGAVKLKETDVAILNYANHAAASFQDLKDFFSCSKIIAFGLLADATVFQQLDMQQNAVTTWQNVRILPGGDLQIVEANRAEKLKFWNGLKQLFDVH